MEFTIKGQDYRLAKLSVFDQLKVTRKLLPVLAGMMADFGSIRALLPRNVRLGNLENVDLSQMGPVFERVLPRIAEELSALTEEDTNAIIYPCLAVVARKHMNGWTPVFSQGVLAFDDIDLFTMLQLVARVVADSLGNFCPNSLPARRRTNPKSHAKQPA